MPTFPLLFLLFLLVPLFELWFLIRVGSWIGALPTVALVVLTAVLGATLARRQGVATLARVRAALERGETPAIEMLEGLVLLAGAFLLLTPGFFTDALGFACLVPGLRRWLALGLLRRLVVVVPGGRPPGPGQPPGNRVIEGEFHREDD